MVDLADKLERPLVADFLRRLKALASTGKFSFVDRENYRQTLAWLGLTSRQAKEMVLGLGVEDYCGGVGSETLRPDEDSASSGWSWTARSYMSSW